MSKRFFPHTSGERKKPKLDVTISDHNFPLSQNIENKETNKNDTWGDDNDDEILLMASQACEEVADISTLPDYGNFMPPTSTSTQMQETSLFDAKTMQSAHNNVPSTSSAWMSTSNINKQMSNSDFSANCFQPKQSTSNPFKLKSNTAQSSGVLQPSSSSAQPISTPHQSISNTFKPISNSSPVKVIPSTSKQMSKDFIFKKPNLNSPGPSTDLLRDKFGRISSPLPGINKISHQNNAFESGSNQNYENEQTSNFSDFVINNKVDTGKDSEYFYKQLLQLQEENNKIKSENSKLQEKCVTKDGECSILRTQLKTAQTTVDNARLDRLKVHEKLQLEWTEKLAVIKNEVRDLKTQLDFKNLEVISAKERCRMMESNKIKLTQVTVAASDKNLSQRFNNNYNDSIIPVPSKRVKLSTSGAQTEKISTHYKLNKTLRAGTKILKEILPLILEPTIENSTYLDTNDKLQSSLQYTQSKCRIFSTFHRVVPSVGNKQKTLCKKLCLSDIYEDISYVATNTGFEVDLLPRYVHIVNQIKLFLQDALNNLQKVAQKMTSAFQRDMDQKYVEKTSFYSHIERKQLVQGKILYEDEQSISARRAIATLAIMCLESEQVSEQVTKQIPSQEASTSAADNESSIENNILDILLQICSFIGNTASAVPYSGLLLSTSILLQNLLNHTQNYEILNKIYKISKEIVESRPLLVVINEILNVFRRLCFKDIVLKFCIESSANLKFDSDQGVVLFRKDSCFLPILVKQVEICMKCMERQGLWTHLIQITQELIGFYRNCCFMNAPWCSIGANTQCDCSTHTAQVLVYALKTCAATLEKKLREIPYFWENNSQIPTSRESITFKGDSRKNPNLGESLRNIQHLDNSLKTMTNKNEHEKINEFPIIPELLAIVRCGIAIVHLWKVNDMDFYSHLGSYSGYFYIFIEICNRSKKELSLDEVQENILTELSRHLQAPAEDLEQPASALSQLWLETFNNFSIT